MDDPKGMLRFLLAILFPKLWRKAGMPMLHREGSDFLANVIKQSMAERKEANVRRNDLIDLLLDAMKNVHADEDLGDLNTFEKEAMLEGVKKSSVPEKDYETLLVSNALLLFFTGFDTTSTMLSIAMHYLATEPDCQETLFQEVPDVLAMHILTSTYFLPDPRQSQ